MNRDECIAFARQAGVDHGWARVMVLAALVRSGGQSDYWTLHALTADELLDLVKRLKAHAELEREMDDDGGRK